MKFRIIWSVYGSDVFSPLWCPILNFSNPSMKYKSTRGTDSDKPKSFEEILLSGFAPDGGLYIPTSIPSASDFLEKWKTKTYKELVFEICRLYIDEEEIPSKDLLKMIDSAYQHFDCSSVVKIVNTEVPIMELFHGPTYSFKDYALSLVSQFLQYFLEKRDKKLTILVGTSGDTGSAAIHSVMNLSRLRIICLYPKGRCSRIQELQMVTIIKDNVDIFRVEGTSDDLDEPIKSVFQDEKYTKENNLCSINSINWARIMIQITHFFYAYFNGAKTISIPTGACGNLAAGFIAIQMGLPIDLIAAVNQNDMVYHCMQTSEFRVDSQVHITISPSMDIQVPYNWERICYFANDSKSSISEIMNDFEKKKKVKIPDGIMKNIKKHVTSQVVSEKETQETIKSFYDKEKYILDPHSAVGVCAAEKLKVKATCIATASPVKFTETIDSILGIKLLQEEEKLGSKTGKFRVMKKGENWEKILRDCIEEK